MRFLMKVSMPVETANKAAQDGFQPEFPIWNSDSSMVLPLFS